MIPRGEVGLIFASIGLAQGVLDDELYGALLLVVLLSTVITPPLLRWRIGATPGADVGELDEFVTEQPADRLDRAQRRRDRPRRPSAIECRHRGGAGSGGAGRPRSAIRAAPGVVRRSP